MVASYLVLSCIAQLCYLSNGLPIDYGNESPRATTTHSVINKLKEAYKFVFQKDTIKTTHADDYEYTTLECFNNFVDIVNGQFFRNRTRWEELQDLTLPPAENYEEDAVDDEVVTEDPLLLRINPELAREAKAEAEKYRRDKKLAKQEAISRMNHYRLNPTRRMYERRMHGTSREESGEPDEDGEAGDGGILGKMGNKVMGGLFNTFHRTFVKAAQSAMGKQDVNVGETFKEDLAQKAKQAGESLKAGLGTVKDKVVEGISKVAGVVGRKIGQLFAKYQHGRHLTRE